MSSTSSSSPSSSIPNADSAPLAGSEVHGTKRGRDMPSVVGQSFDRSAQGAGGSVSPQSDPPSDLLSQDPLDRTEHSISPLAKKGRHVTDDPSSNEANPPVPLNGDIGEGLTSSNEGSDHSPSKSRTETPEANEVKSVRKKVEGMGVETEQEQPVEATSRDEVMFDRAAETSVSGDPRQNLHSFEGSASSSPHSEHQTRPSEVKDDSSTKAEEALQPSSWATYASATSPFVAFAPTSAAPIFSAPSAPSSRLPSTASTPISSRPLARAFASPLSSPKKMTNNTQLPLLNPTSGPSSLGSSSPSFPCSSEFFFKGKRNTPLGGLTSENDVNTPGQHKKVKLPQSLDQPTGTQGFAAYSNAPSMSLQPAALEKLNNDPSLQVPSQTAPYLNVPPPGSTASSVCAVNGDADDPLLSPALSTTSVMITFPHTTATSPSPLGFSSFSNPAGFVNAHEASSWTTSSPSVFEQIAKSDEPTFATEIVHEGDEWGGKLNQKKTHLALAADLSQEDRHEGFSAKEVLTGEENEDLIKSIRCKVFTLGEDGSWHERGSGGLRLLCTKEQPHRYRLIMRADAVLRVLLNVPIFKGFSYRPSQDKFLSFASTSFTGLTSNGEAEAGREGENKAQFQQYLCRFGKPEARQEMIDSIKECLDDLESRSEIDPSTTTASEPVLSGAQMV